jgi:CheY-like chemotaxis protein
MNILIAEDNQYTAFQYDKILQKFGHNVVIAKDGEECVNLYKESLKKSTSDKIEENPFDVVVLDQSMPKKVGSQAAQEILDTRPSQRIVFASAYGLTAEKNYEDFKERIEFLQKPFSLTKFVKTITNEEVGN